MCRLPCFLLVLLPLLALPARAQQPVGVVELVVRDALTGAPLAGAEVLVVGAALRATTDERGRALLRGVPVGTRALRVRAIGFAPATVNDLAVGTGKPAEVEVTLVRQAITLESLEVVPWFRSPPDAPTGTRTLTAEETRRAPGVQEDVVRAVALLPGVGVTAAGRNDLVVRGGAPYENLFLVDGIPVANINHFGSQGSTGGPLTIINTDFVREVTFSAGGFPVRYGHRTAALTDIALREGSRERLSGEVNLSATGAWLIGEGPVGEGSFLVSLRRSYLDLLFSAAGFSFVPQYWDFQGKVTHPLAGGRLEGLFFGALDEVSFTNDDADDRYDNSRILAPDQRQYVAGLRWLRPLRDGRLNLALGRTWVRYRTAQYDSLVPPGTVFQNDATEGAITGQAEVVRRTSDRLELSAGASARVATTLAYDVVLTGPLRLDEQGNEAPLAVDTTLSEWDASAWTQASWRPEDGLDLTAGLRLDRYDAQQATRLSPRLGASLALSGRTRLLGGIGRYVQPPSSIWRIGDPGNDTRLEPIVADQGSVGVEVLVRPDLRLQVEAWGKRYRDYPARIFRPQAVLAPSGFEDATADIPFGLEPLTSEAEGTSWGGELLLQKRLAEGRTYGLASVTVSRNRFRALDGTERPGAYDTRLILTTLAGWRPSPGWELSGKFRLASGAPTTPFITEGPAAGQLDFSQYNAGPRLPTFHALDLRVDRRWRFPGWQLTTYLDVQNVYGRANISGYRWDPRTQAPEADESIGILPTIGINIEF